MRNILIVLLVFSLPIASSACSTSSDNDSPMPMAKPAAVSTVEQPSEPMVITIGSLTDKTGAGSNAMKYVDMGFADAIKYYNENHLISGIEVRLLEYDGGSDPAKDIPGYEWLMERKADIIAVWLPWAPTVLRTRADKDGIPLFCANARNEVLYPPGHLFATNLPLEELAWTMIKWIAENDWDYLTRGPARIGGACWDYEDCDVAFKAIERYAELHPEQFEWISGHMTPVATFSWTPEVESLKDCDYIWLPGVSTHFLREYREQGYTAKALGNEAHLAFFRLIIGMELWDEFDGSLFVMSSKWWNEEGELVNLVNQLVQQNHPDDMEDIKIGGKGYFSVINTVQILEIIKATADTVGPENVTSQTIYETAQSFTLMTDGIQHYSYTETKRASVNYISFYEVRESEEDLFRISDWIPVVHEP